MPHGLTSEKKANRGQVLTGRRNMPFIICFSRQLETRFDFSSLKQADIQAFHKFFRKTIGISVSHVDNNYLRKPDKNDSVGGFDILHYEVSNSFRIHGYYDKSLFHVIRLDCDHKFHNC
jgi:hypothetical protein